MIKTAMAILMLVSLIACNTGSEPKNTVMKTDSIASPADTGSMAPYLFSGTNGVYLSWIEKKQEGSFLKYAVFNNDQWSEATTINAGKNWFVNWADYPLLAANYKGQMLAHYLEKSASGTYTYDIRMLTSATNGKKWSPSFVLHDDGKKAEHGFVSMIPYGDHFFVSWLDGRNTAMPEGMDHSSYDGHGMGAMTLRAAIVDINGKKLNEWELDDRVCDCCQTNAAITKEGPVVVYRNRSDDEVRDISIVRYINGKWTAPQVIHPDNWNIEGCPVNGPRVAAMHDEMAVAWFASPNNMSLVQVIFSSDGGKTFSSPVRIDEGNSIGRVDVELLGAGQALVSWMEGADIKVLKINKDGKKEAVTTVASSSSARSSGFPQMARNGDEVYFAWVDDQSNKIKLTRLHL